MKNYCYISFIEQKSNHRKKNIPQISSILERYVLKNILIYIIIYNYVIFHRKTLRFFLKLSTNIIKNILVFKILSANILQSLSFYKFKLD